MKFSDFEIIESTYPAWMDDDVRCQKMIVLKLSGKSIATITQTNGGKYIASIDGRNYLSAGRTEKYCLQTIYSMIKSKYDDAKQLLDMFESIKKVNK